MARWDEGQWLNPPVAARIVKGDLHVEAAEGSDFWQETAYGFRRDSGHGLLAPFQQGTAVEVSFVVDFDSLYDQSGVLLRVAERNWIKAGVEVSDGAPQLSCVVTTGLSDWSLAPVPEWNGKDVTIRASWAGDAVTLRAREKDGPWRLHRVAPFRAGGQAFAGPYCCAPQRAGLTVRFTDWIVTDADTALHAE